MFFIVKRCARLLFTLKKDRNEEKNPHEYDSFPLIILPCGIVDFCGKHPTPLQSSLCFHFKAAKQVKLRCKNSIHKTEDTIFLNKLFFLNTIVYCSYFNS